MTTALITPTSELPDAAASCESHSATYLAASLDDVSRVTGAWRTLRARFGPATLNNDIDRYLETVRQAGPAVRPHVLAMSSPADPIAVMIGRAHNRRLSHTLGYCRIPGIRLRCLDIVYGGIITDNSPQSIRGVISYLSDALHSRDFDLVTINHEPVSSPLHASLLANSDLRRRLVPASADAHWRLALEPHSYDEVISRFTRKHRYNMRRAARLLSTHFDDDVQLICVRTRRDLDRFAPDAADLVASTYQRSIPGAFRATPPQLALLGVEADRDCLRAYGLYCRGRLVAFQIGVTRQGVYHLGSTAFLPQYKSLSPGQALLVRVIADLCDAGLHWIDYGFGDAEYKRAYGSECWDEVTIHLYGTSLRARCTQALQAVTTSLSRRARHLTAQTALARRMKRRWRNFLTPGGRTNA